MNTESWPRPRPLVVIALLCLYAASLARDIDCRWFGMHDWNGAIYSYQARNLLRYPISVTRLLPVVHMGWTPPAAEEAVRYSSHPPGLVWLLAGSFAALGVSEWAARLVPIACSLASLWLLMRITASTQGRTVAAITGILFATMPMATFFGRMVDQEPVCLFFMLLAWWGWFAMLGSVATGRSRRFCRVACLTGTTGAMLVDWAGALGAATIVVHALAKRRRGACSGGTLAAAFLVPAATGVAIVLLLVYGGLDGSWAALRDIFVSRSRSIVETGTAGDPAMQDGPWRFTVDNFGCVVMALAAVGLLCLMCQGLANARQADDSSNVIGVESRGGAGLRGQDARATNAPLLMMLGVGVGWLALFWPQFVRHNYWQFYLAAPVAVLGGIGLVRLHGIAIRILPARVAEATAVIVLVVAIGFGLHGTNSYFARRSYSPERLEMWARLGRQLDPDEGVILSTSFVHVEERGAYRFRNLVPPQLVYYLDRRALRSSDPREVVRLAHDYSVWLIDGEQTGLGVLSNLPAEWPVYANGRFLVVDMRPQRGREYGELLNGAARH